MTDDVRKRSAEVEEMAKHWPLVDALLGGTTAMRAASEKYLPKWPNEEPASYTMRLNTATLFPAFGRTVEVLAGKPFSKPLTIGEDVPTRLKAWCEDIDLEGRNLHAFAASICENAISSGYCGILVDYPQTGDMLRTQAQEQAAGVRPYFVHVRHENILGWRAKRQAGQWELTQLRLLECVKEEAGQFGEKIVEQVRVLTPGAWEIWRKSEAAQNSVRQEWVLVEKGRTTLGKIPFVPVYGKRKAFMVSLPPLLDLAHMNVEHWQSKSDQQTILHVARVPILCRIGGEEGDKITVGASTAVLVPVGGDLKWVEHGGKAIDAGRMSLLDLEDRMRQAGAELLVIKPGNTTEVQTLADNEQGMCALQRIVVDEEDALCQALQLAAEWVNESTGGHVTIFKDFGAATLAEASAELLLKMTMAGKLSDETLFNETKRRGMVAADVQWKEEQERIGEQAPPLGTIGSEGDDDGAAGAA